MTKNDLKMPPAHGTIIETHPVGRDDIQCEIQTNDPGQLLNMIQRNMGACFILSNFTADKLDRDVVVAKLTFRPGHGVGVIADPKQQEPTSDTSKASRS